MKEMKMSSVALNKHDLVLILVGLALENRKVGDEYSINEIARDVNLHHRTVRKALEHIYYAQNFIPKIDMIFKEGGRIHVKIEDLPTYQTRCVEPERVVLLKLFNKEAWFGKKIRYEADIGEILRLASKLDGLIEVDRDTGMIGLSSNGADEAFEMVEDLSQIRDLAIKSIKDGSQMLRKRMYKKTESPVQIIRESNDVKAQMENRIRDVYSKTHISRAIPGVNV